MHFPQGCTVRGAGGGGPGGGGGGAPYVGHRELKGELLIGMLVIDNVKVRAQ